MSILIKQTNTDQTSGFDVANLDKNAAPLEAYDNILEKSFTKKDEMLLKAKKPGWWERTKDSFEGRTDEEARNEPDACKVSLEPEKVEDEKAGFLVSLEETAEKVSEFSNSCGFQRVKDVVLGASQAAQLGMMTGSNEDRIKAALVGLNKALPFKISESCQNIIDNFASKLGSQNNGYMVGDADLNQYVDSDEVKCAMDALDMLSGIKGLSDKVLNFVQDIEASAIVIAGMINTLADYGLTGSIAAVLGLSKFKEVTERALGLASPNLIELGDVDLLDWMIDEGGLSSCISYNPDLADKILAHYVKRNLPLGAEDNIKLIILLNRIDPNWNKFSGDIFDMDTLGGASDDAVSAFEEDPILGPILITNEIFEDNPTLKGEVEVTTPTDPSKGKTSPTYPSLPDVGYGELPKFTSDGTKPSRLSRILPTVGEITRIIYPKATGPGLIKNISISDPRYFYV